jgi:general secretion pathway protein L
MKLKLDRPINSDFGRFLRWWRGELAFLIPEKLKRLLGRKRSYLLLTRQADFLEINICGDRYNDCLGRFSLDEEGAARLRDRFAENAAWKEAKVVLRLFESQVLRRTLKLPAATEENLTQVIAFEMDRLTPFKAEQVYYGVKVLERLPETAQIRIELVLIPRNRLDVLLEELAVFGWHPEIVDAGTEDVLAIAEIGKYNLLPEKFQPRRDGLPKLLQTALAGTLTLLLLAIFILPIVMERSFAQALEQRLKVVSKTAKEVESLRRDAENVLHETRFLLDKKHNEPALVDILEELTRRIPDHTWLTGLQFRDRRLLVQGQSPSASELIALIESSPFFQNTNFVSPVTKDATSNQERFQISIEVVNGRIPENPAD